MLRKILRRVVRPFRRPPPSPDAFLKRCQGVIHVGANTGQERAAYASFGLRVLWIEPIPEVYGELVDNLRGFPEQRALQHLLTDRPGVTYRFHVASNGGASSSLLDFKHHTDIWPDIRYERTISLESTTLAQLIDQGKISLAEYDTLILDTQGSELLVLKGSAPYLRHFRFIKTEVADFESYAGCCQLDELTAYLASYGFRERRRTPFARRAAGGCYYDILFGRHWRVPRPQPS